MSLNNENLPEYVKKALAHYVSLVPIMPHQVLKDEGKPYMTTTIGSSDRKVKEVLTKDWSLAATIECPRTHRLTWATGISKFYKLPVVVELLVSFRSALLNMAR